jgi:hypothetical protein
MRPALAAAAVLCSGASHAQTSTASTTYPEFARPALLANVVEAMRRELRDPASVVDLTMCDPIKVKSKDGRPVRWTVMLSFNTKKGFGGYVGRSYYGAVFYANRPPTLSEIVSAGAEGLNSLIARAVEKQMVGCPRVLNADLQQALNR